MAFHWLSGHMQHRAHSTASAAHAAAVLLGRARSDTDHARVRVLGRVARLRPAIRRHDDDGGGDAAGGGDGAAAEATPLEERGVPAAHMHFEVERVLRCMGVATRADVTAHRGELFPDLFLLPSPPHPPHHHQPQHHQHHHYHHHRTRPHAGADRQQAGHADGGGGGGGGGGKGGGVIIQALDAGCFSPGTQDPTDYVLAKQVPARARPGPLDWRLPSRPSFLARGRTGRRAAGAGERK